MYTLFIRIFKTIYQVISVVKTNLFKIFELSFHSWRL